MAIEKVLLIGVSLVFVFGILVFGESVMTSVNNGAPAVETALTDMLRAARGG